MCYFIVSKIILKSWRSFTVNSKADFKVLIVEDDELLLQSIAGLIEDDGFAVITAEDGDAALKTLKIEKVHFVLSDIQMPNKDGIELLKDIRSKCPDPPAVLLMSGYSSVSKEDAQKLGAIDLVSKPANLTSVTETIAKVYLSLKTKSS